jgi:hypothetical protein
VARRPKRDVDQPTESDLGLIRLLRDEQYLKLADAGFSPRKIAKMTRPFTGIGSKRHVTRRIKSLCEAMGRKPPWEATSTD